MYCAKHPKVETALSCGRCGTPICPACTVHGPVGCRCKACASQRSSSLYQVRPERLVLATVLGLAAGTIVGMLLQALTGFFMYFLLFIGPAIGGAVGTVILKASGHKRGLVLEVVAGGSVVVGAIVSQFISGGWAMLFNPLNLVVYLVAVGLTASAAVGRIRYM